MRKHKRSIDHYATLGIPFGATAQEIKIQYKKMVLKYHPDKNNGNTSPIFNEVQESYEALNDDKFREEYDIFHWPRVRCQPQDIEQRRQEREEFLRKEEDRQRKEEELQRDRERLRKEYHQEREREAKLQQDREKLKRKQDTDDNIHSLVQTLQCQLRQSNKQLVAWKKQFWKLNNKYDALLQKNIDRDAEIQRDAKRQRVDITAELLQICANGVRHYTKDGTDFYSVIDFMKKVCTEKDKTAVNRTWEYFRDRSKFKDEIDKLMYRQNCTPTANISGIERMLTILGKKHIGTEFYSLVDKANKTKI